MKIILSVIILTNMLFAEYIRFKDHGIVYDTSTTLMWQDEDITATDWEGAIVTCEILQLGNYTDWRLPNIRELFSIIDYRHSYPATVDLLFIDGNLQDLYWSSTTYKELPSHAVGLIFGSGISFNYNKITSNQIRCVRGGP